MVHQADAADMFDSFNGIRAVLEGFQLASRPESSCYAFQILDPALFQCDMDVDASSSSADPAIIIEPDPTVSYNVPWDEVFRRVPWPKKGSKRCHDSIDTADAFVLSRFKLQSLAQEMVKRKKQGERAASAAASSLPPPPASAGPTEEKGRGGS